jgi:hypothetical protein
MVFGPPVPVATRGSFRWETQESIERPRLATEGRRHGLPVGARPRGRAGRREAVGGTTRGQRPAVTRVRLAREGKALEGRASVGKRRDRGRHAQVGAPKPGGPHDWQRDATSPQSRRRRKPSRWWETTRTERDRGLGMASTEVGFGPREWTPVVRSMEGRTRGTLWKAHGEPAVPYDVKCVFECGSRPSGAGARWLRPDSATVDEQSPREPDERSRRHAGRSGKGQRPGHRLRRGSKPNTSVPDPQG